MIITKHGKLRIKERVGLPKRAHLRHVQKVLSGGLLHSRKGFEKFQVLYHGFLYIFALDDKFQPILVTTYQSNEVSSHD
jgi:hypothetical protein